MAADEAVRHAMIQGRQDAHSGSQTGLLEWGPTPSCSHPALHSPLHPLHSPAKAIESHKTCASTAQQQDRLLPWWSCPFEHLKTHAACCVQLPLSLADSAPVSLSELLPWGVGSVAGSTHMPTRLTPACSTMDDTPIDTRDVAGTCIALRLLRTAGHELLQLRCVPQHFLWRHVEVDRRALLLESSHEQGLISVT